MSKITLESINQELAPYGWACQSESYKNLDSELIFSCDKGHLVYSTWKKIRAKRECPACQEKNFSSEIISKIEPKKKNLKRTLALDQATHTTGWAIFDGTELIRYGTFTTNLKDVVARCSAIKNWLLSMINNWQPDYIGLEGIQFQEESSGKKVSVTVFQDLARLQGVLMVTCFELKKDCTICPTNTWRKHCGVKGRYRADKKKSMQLIAKEKYGITATDDETDAIGIGQYVADLNNIKMVNWE